VSSTLKENILFIDPAGLRKPIAGGTSSTTALAVSTEGEQFEQPVAMRMAGSPSQV
jgi:hypothetical protein